MSHIHFQRKVNLNDNALVSMKIRTEKFFSKKSKYNLTQIIIRLAVLIPTIMVVFNFGRFFKALISWILNFFSPIGIISIPFMIYTLFIFLSVTAVAFCMFRLSSVKRNPVKSKLDAICRILYPLNFLFILSLGLSGAVCAWALTACNFHESKFRFQFYDSQGYTFGSNSATISFFTYNSFWLGIIYGISYISNEKNVLYFPSVQEEFSFYFKSRIFLLSSKAFRMSAMCTSSFYVLVYLHQDYSYPGDTTMWHLSLLFLCFAFNFIICVMYDLSHTLVVYYQTNTIRYLYCNPTFTARSNPIWYFQTAASSSSSFIKYVSFLYFKNMPLEHVPEFLQFQFSAVNHGPNVVNECMDTCLSPLEKLGNTLKQNRIQEKQQLATRSKVEKPLKGPLDLLSSLSLRLWKFSMTLFQKQFNYLRIYIGEAIIGKHNKKKPSASAPQNPRHNNEFLSPIKNAPPCRQIKQPLPLEYQSNYSPYPETALQPLYPRYDISNNYNSTSNNHPSSSGGVESFRYGPNNNQQPIQRPSRMATSLLAPDANACSDEPAVNYQENAVKDRPEFDFKSLFGRIQKYFSSMYLVKLATAEYPNYKNHVLFSEWQLNLWAIQAVANLNFLADSKDFRRTLNRERLNRTFKVLLTCLSEVEHRKCLPEKQSTLYELFRFSPIYVLGLYVGVWIISVLKAFIFSYIYGSMLFTFGCELVILYLTGAYVIETVRLWDERSSLEKLHIPNEPKTIEIELKRAIYDLLNHYRQNFNELEPTTQQQLSSFLNYRL